MVKELDDATLRMHVDDPGIAVVHWRDPEEDESLQLDQALDVLSHAHRDVRFGALDVTRSPRLADEYDIDQAPTLCAYRDGTLVFSRPGSLPAAAIDALLQAVWSLDMAEVRRGLNGGGTRLVLEMSPDDGSFDLIDVEGEPPGGGTPPQRS